MIHVSGLTWARRHKADFDAVLSVEDPGRNSDRLRFKEPPAHLILSFYDLDYPFPTPYHEPWMRLAEPSDIIAALSFAARYDNLLVHCRVGVGRSPAIALAILMDRLGDPQRALDALLEICPNAVPNRRVIEIADELLGCKRRLLQTFDDWDSGRYDHMARRRLCRLLHLYQFNIPPLVSNAVG